MEIILRKDVQKLGKAGEVISVKTGYARNFLFPQGLALEASANNLKVVEREKDKTLLRQQQQKQQAQGLADKIKSVSCTITVRAGQDGKLFGSVTSQDVAEAYKSEGIELDKRKIELEQPIKEEGVYKIQLKLHPEITAEAKIWVVKE
ncbi:MAG: 50S ribosomal protein L9 [Candidatus Omnitrophica bacterium]|nr:50S ribosomal protein L9 [Candidatus Omnitrophota bacterium]